MTDDAKISESRFGFLPIGGSVSVLYPTLSDGRINDSRVGFLPLGGTVSMAFPELSTTDQWHWLLELHKVDGELLHYLQNAVGCGYEVQVNGIGRFWGSVPIDATKSPEVTAGRELCLRERNQQPKVFVIRNLNRRQLYGRGKFCVIDADEIIGVLNDDIIESDYITEDTVTNILTYILSLQKRANPIILGGVDGVLDETISVDWQDRPTLLKAVRDVRDRVGGIVEVVVDEVDQTIRKLWLRSSIGEDKGQQVRWGKNITGIEQIIETRDMATKLYPVGMVGEVPFYLNALSIDTEQWTKDSDASYGYLTISGQYSRYYGWTGAGDALPDDMVIYKDDVDDTANWEQAGAVDDGDDAQKVRCAIGDYSAGSTYTVTYTHADYIQTSPSGNMHPITRQYTRHDISVAQDLLDAARIYMSAWGGAATSYKVTLPSRSASGLDFDSLRLGSTVAVIAEDLSIDASVAINRLSRPDIRRPERMEIEVVRTLPVWRVIDIANQVLSKDPVRLYNTKKGQFWGTGILGVGGSQMGGLSFKATQNYSLRYVRIRALVQGSIGPTLVVALIETDEKTNYYDGSAVLAHTFIGPGMFPAYNLGFAYDNAWSEQIPLRAALTENVYYMITVHAPYGDVGAGDYLATGCSWYSTDDGQAWAFFTYPPAAYPDLIGIETYGVPREG